MAMPEAAVNENHRLVFRKHNVRSPRQLLSMKSESVPHAVEKGTYHLLRCGVLPANATHIPASALFAQPIVHSL
jgi:hypothetical protein